jgi:hypothetical protein
VTFNKLNASTFCPTIGNSIKYLIPLNPDDIFTFWIFGYYSYNLSSPLLIFYIIPSKFLSEYAHYDGYLSFNKLILLIIYYFSSKYKEPRINPAIINLL